jgi:hypothetical protein
MSNKLKDSKDAAQWTALEVRGGAINLQIPKQRNSFLKTKLAYSQLTDKLTSYLGMISLFMVPFSSSLETNRKVVVPNQPTFIQRTTNFYKNIDLESSETDIFSDEDIKIKLGDGEKTVVIKKSSNPAVKGVKNRERTRRRQVKYFRELIEENYSSSEGDYEQTNTIRTNSDSIRIRTE